MLEAVILSQFSGYVKHTDLILMLICYVYFIGYTNIIYIYIAYVSIYMCVCLYYIYIIIYIYIYLIFIYIYLYIYIILKAAYIDSKL